MILKRLADGIREQNWFTVFIELMIVVAIIAIISAIAMISARVRYMR